MKLWLLVRKTKKVVQQWATPGQVNAPSRNCAQRSSGVTTGPADPASGGGTLGGRHFEDLLKELANLCLI